MPEYDDDVNQQCVDGGPNQSVDDGSGDQCVDPDAGTDQGDQGDTSQDAPQNAGGDGAGGAPVIYPSGAGGAPATDPECHPDGPNAVQRAWNWWWGTRWGMDKGVPERCLDKGSDPGEIPELDPPYDGPSIGPAPPGGGMHHNGDHGGHEHDPHGWEVEEDKEMPELPEARTPEMVE
jgi:hypothetical protein